MKSVKFLHCGDFHMDTPFTSLSTEPGVSSIRRNDIKETFEKVIKAAKDEEVDILLISGDLYEQSCVKKATINFVNDKFNEILNIEVFIVPGNHDPYIANSYYKNFKWAKNVHILSSENPYVVLSELQACIYGFGFNNFTEEKSIIKEIEHFDDYLINILLVHGTVDMRFGEDSYNPMSSEELFSMNMDYIALGHFHNKIEDIGGFGVIYNAGSPEPLGFDEEGDHGVFIGTIAKDNANKSSLDIKFEKLSKRNYKKVKANVSGCSTDEQVIDRIKEAVTHETNNLYSVVLSGYIENGFAIGFQNTQAYFQSKVFFIRIIDETRPDYDFEEIKREPGLRGNFTRKMFEFIEKAGTEAEKKVFFKALYYGIEALEQGKILVS